MRDPRTRHLRPRRRGPRVFQEHLVAHGTGGDGAEEADSQGSEGADRVYVLFKWDDGAGERRYV